MSCEEELARIRGLVEDRPKLTQFIVQQIPVLTTHYAAHVADELRSYLFPRSVCDTRIGRKSHEKVQMP